MLSPISFTRAPGVARFPTGTADRGVIDITSRDRKPSMGFSKQKPDRKNQLVLTIGTYFLHQPIRAGWAFGYIHRPERFGLFPSCSAGFTHGPEEKSSSIWMFCRLSSLRFTSYSPLLSFLGFIEKYGHQFYNARSQRDPPSLVARVLPSGAPSVHAPASVGGNQYRW